MKLDRLSGILMHPTSFPSEHGIGDLGQGAYDFINFLHQSGQGLWQILPLNPTSNDGCPYNSYSAFAGNPYLIALPELVEMKLLTGKDIEVKTVFNPEFVEFERVFKFKDAVLAKAFKNFRKDQKAWLYLDYEEFCAAESHWLSDFALFAAIRKTKALQPWYQWEDGLKFRIEKAITAFKAENYETIEYEKFLQFLFYKQWKKLKEYANSKNIKVIGDIPIYVSYDSVDVWTNTEAFNLDKDLKPITISGVPPDYFSETGQLWGNPTYNWKHLKKTDFKWWIKRIKHTLFWQDFIRIDHFRGLATYWAVPFGEENAINGTWEKAKGNGFFKQLQKEMGRLPILVEDLGEITPDVIKLREDFDFPGMKILQFAFDSKEDNDFLPHNYPKNAVVFTGTHDNDTVLGWYQNADFKDQEFARLYIKGREESIAWDFIGAAWSSNANFSITTPQDLLELGSEARMNIPGTTENNWKWRVREGALSVPIAERLRFLTELYFRLPSIEEA